jgi:tetratricopeptide (TPR) repeat protein
MGNRTSLTIGSDSEIIANNCIPVIWLALFRSHDFGIETRTLNHEEFHLVLYKSTVKQSKSHVEESIELLQSHSSVWRFLRPLEIIQRILASHHEDAEVILDATQIWSFNLAMRINVKSAASNFNQFAKKLTSDPERDLSLLSDLINMYSTLSFSSIEMVHPKSLMDILFGGYFGRDDSQYSSEAYIGEYWSADGDTLEASNIQNKEEHLEQEFSQDELKGIMRSLEFYSKPPPAGWRHQGAAACYVQLKNYDKALKYFRLALREFLKAHESTVLPSSLVNSYALSHQPHLHKRVGNKITHLVKDPTKLHPGERYALIVHGLLMKMDSGLQSHIQELTNSSADEYYKAIGSSFVSICNADEELLRDNLIFLLKKHQNDMKSGIIRASYISLEAMTLSFLSAIHGYEIHIKSKYYSERYIRFLLTERRRRKGLISRITTQWSRRRGQAEIQI